MVLVASRVAPVLILKYLFFFTLGELLSKVVEITAVLPYVIFEQKFVSSAALLVIEFIKLQVFVGMSCEELQCLGFYDIVTFLSFSMYSSFFVCLFCGGLHSLEH